MRRLGRYLARTTHFSAALFLALLLLPVFGTAQPGSPPQDQQRDRNNPRQAAPDNMDRNRERDRGARGNIFELVEPITADVHARHQTDNPRVNGSADMSLSSRGRGNSQLTINNLSLTIPSRLDVRDIVVRMNRATNLSVSRDGRKASGRINIRVTLPDIRKSYNRTANIAITRLDTPDGDFRMEFNLYPNFGRLSSTYNVVVNSKLAPRR